MRYELFSWSFVTKGMRRMEKTGKRVQKVMKARGMTQSALAKAIGKDQTLISRFFSGDIEVSDTVALYICRELGMGLGDVLESLHYDRLMRRQAKLDTEFNLVSTSKDFVRKKTLIGTCGTCGEWEPEPVAIHGKCPILNALFGGYDQDNHSVDSIIFDGNDLVYGDLLFGRNFGCVHWRDKDGQG
jgi:transcriptional regulator with XRE-family HTH domain